MTTLSIPLRFAELSYSNTVSFDYIFDTERVQSTAHSWSHETDLRPDADRSSNQVVVYGTVIRLDDGQYFAYAVVDRLQRSVAHEVRVDERRRKTTRGDVFAERLLREVHNEHDVDDPMVPVDRAAPLHRACRNHDFGFGYERHGSRNGGKRIGCSIKFGSIGISIVSATATRNCWRVTRVVRAEPAWLNTTPHRSDSVMRRCSGTRSTRPARHDERGPIHPGRPRARTPRRQLTASPTSKPLPPRARSQDRAK